MTKVVDRKAQRIEELRLFIAQKTPEMKQLEAQKIAVLQQLALYQKENRLEYFDKPPNKGPNPKQAQIIQAFLDPAFKTFGFSAGNRSGKTTLAVILALSVMRGKYLWSEQSLLHLFPHKNPRKVRYIGQGWHEHIQTVIIPELEKWWPKRYKVEDHGNGIITKTFWKDVETKSTLQLMCLHPDQRIIMGNGYEKPIKDIKLGDEIICSEGITKVKNIYESNCDVFYKIRTFSGREITCSANHEIRTKNGSYIKAHRLTCNDVIDSKVIPYKPGKNKIEDWKLALTGILIGDGYISGACAEWTCFSDKLLEWVKGLLPDDLKISAISQRKQGGVYRITQIRKRNYNPLIVWLKNCNLWGTNSYTKFIPEEIFEQTPNKIGLFLSGLFSTDGTFGGCQVTYTSRSARLVDDIKRLLRRIGVTASTSSYYRESFFDGYDCSGIVNICRFGGSENIRQFSRYVQFIGKKMDWDGFVKSMTQRKPVAKKDRIVKISLIEGGHCLDLEVESMSHNYFVDGILVHNSNNQQPKEHESWEGDLIVYDEPPKREIYIANARGLVDRRGREVFAATLLDEPWIDHEIIKKVGVDGKPDRSVFWIEGTTYDNVGYGITQEGVDEFMSKLTEDEIQARIYGVPAYKQGLVYLMFNRKEHLVPWFRVPLDWMVDIAIDVHPRERQAVTFMATDQRNDRYVCDEIWEYGDGTQLGEMIVRKVHQNDYRVNRVIIDPLSKGDKNNPETVFQKVANVLLRHDMALGTAVKDLSAGILSVKTHLKGPNNKASLFLMDNCQRTLYEMEGYTWDSKTGKPIDKDDHSMENLYRLCLLNTRYVEPEDEYDYSMAGVGDSGRNKVTGY